MNLLTPKINFNPVIISAPFGNYYNWLRFNSVTYTLGTFTRYERNTHDEPKGSKWYRVLTTVRYSMALKGWKNRIGLKNPGINWLCNQQSIYNIKVPVKGKHGIDTSDKIVSIYGFDHLEWNELLYAVSKIKPLAVELNTSCPNVHKLPFTSDLFKRALDINIPIIVKIPPVFYHEIVDMAYTEGIRIFHACNTIPSPIGGISGKPLLQLSQNVVKWLHNTYSDIKIIGGGGITTCDDAIAYCNNGADSVALGTMLFNPLNRFKIKSIVKVVENERNRTKSRN